MTVTSPIVDNNSLGASHVTTAVQADDRFLRRILGALVISTILTGAVAAYASVNESQAGQVNFVLPVMAAR